MHAVGIDIGTTSICGVLLDAESGEILKKKTVASEAFVQSEQPWEKIQDVSKILMIAVDILANLTDDMTMVIGLTGQMHGILYTNEEGRAVSPLYTWQDERGNLPYKDMTYAAYLDGYAGYGAVSDFYNRINGLRPEEAVSYCTIQDYLGMVLCGMKRPVIHTSNAAGFGCFDLEKGQFREMADSNASVKCDAEVTGDYRIIGSYHGIPVSVAIGDNQASVFSTVADRSSVLVNVGTGSQVTVISDKVIRGEGIETRPYVEGKYLVVGAALCGGRAYAVLKDFYREVLQAAGGDTSDVYGIMEQFMENAGDVTDAELKVDTRFAGTRSNPGLRGSITGISEKNFVPGVLTKAVLAGMVQELYGMYEVMQVSCMDIVGSGNGIRQNRKLIEVIENTFDGKLRLPLHREEAAYGAALFGLVACGRFKNAAEAQKLIRYEEV